MGLEVIQKNKILLTSLTYFVLLCLWGTVFFLQQKIDYQRGEFHTVKSFHYLPSGKYLRVVALEFKEATADILWLEAIQFIGDRDLSGQQFDWFYELLERVTDLDSKFVYAYHTGGIVLSVLSDNVRLSNAILEKGFKNNPDDWQIPFYLGFNYLYHIKDNLKAAHYMEEASKREGSPPYLPLLAARLYKKGGEKQTALVFLEGMYRMSKDEKIRERIAQRIEEMKQEENPPLYRQDSKQ